MPAHACLKFAVWLGRGWEVVSMCVRHVWYVYAWHVMCANKVRVRARNAACMVRKVQCRAHASSGVCVGNARSRMA